MWRFQFFPLCSLLHFITLVGRWKKLKPTHCLLHLLVPTPTNNPSFATFLSSCLPFLPTMSSTPRLTRSEVFLRGTKYLHENGTVYVIRDTPKSAKAWSLDAWRGRKAPVALQNAFTRLLTIAPACEGCGHKHTELSTLCAYCQCAKALKTVKTSPTKSTEPCIYSLEDGIHIIGYKLNYDIIYDKFMDVLEDEDAVYDYIMDETFKKDMQTYFPGSSKCLQMFKKDVPSADHEFYVGYPQTTGKSSTMNDKQKKALTDFYTKFSKYIA